MTLRYHTPLSPQEQAELGIDPPAPLAMADRVRFGELDVLNHVNNAVYMQWFESVRVGYLSLFAETTYAEAGFKPRIVIRSATVHYREEMRLGESYVVTCACTTFRNTSLTMHQQIWSDKRLRATLDVVLVLLNPNGTGRYPIPQALRRHFIDVDGATPEN